jgi:hypothetical protein
MLTQGVTHTTVGTPSCGSGPPCPRSRPVCFDLLASAGAEAGEALAGAAFPLGADRKAPRRRARGGDDALVVELEADIVERATQAVAVPARRTEGDRLLELLAGEHALGELNELVA